MKRSILLLMLIIGFSQILTAQIEIKITRVGKDSFNIEFPSDMDLIMNQSYTFVIKTNIREEDNLYDNLSETKIKNDKLFEYKFDYHEFSFDIEKYNRKKEAIVVASKMIFVKGTKYIVKIDGKLIKRSEPNDITPKSKVDIELTSDTEDIDGLRTSDPVVLYWMYNQRVFQKFELKDRKASINLSELGELKKGKTNQKFNYLIILLPQVFKGQTKLLPDKQGDRMYIMMYMD